MMKAIKMTENKKIVEKGSYLTSDELITFLNKNKILIDRTDNIRRFATQHSIKMKIITRIGKAGAAPAVFERPTQAKLKNIRVSRKQIRDVVDRIEKQNNMSKGGMAKLLNKNNIDTLTYERQIEANISWRQIVRRKFFLMIFFLIL